MNCLVCKSGTLADGAETYFARLNDGYIIVENVPCKKCGQCGEILYSASTIEKIEELLEVYSKVSSKIFIVDYRRAA